MSIQRLWNAIPIFSTNLMESRIISTSLNAQVTQVALEAFDSYSSTRSQSIPQSNTLGNQDQDKTQKRRTRTRTTARARGRTKTLEQSKHVTHPLAQNVQLDHNTCTHSDSGLTTNDYFFEHQRVNGYTNGTPIISQSAAVCHLHEALTKQTQHYFHLLSVGVDNQASTSASTAAAAAAAAAAAGIPTMVDRGILSLDLWAAVQRGAGAYHKEHVHEGVLLSGVYYSCVPSGSAPLVLHKPHDLVNSSGHSHRSEDRVIVEPREGQVVLFPPWLLHGVPPVDENDGNDLEAARVSFAFNLSGAFMGGDPWSVTQQFMEEVR